MKLRIVIKSILVFLQVFSVSAHGDEPRLEINAESLNPGSTLEVRGVDFEFEEQVHLVLVGPPGERSLGSATGDIDGVFLLTIPLPVDLVEGTYLIRATTDDHVIESPQITIWGTAQLQGEGEERREEQDALLAPMPTLAPGTSSTPFPQQAVPESADPKPGSAVLILSILTGIGILSLIGIRVLKKR